MGVKPAQKSKLKPAQEWILIVDDDPEITRNLVEGLGKMGFRAVQASSVAEARTKLSKQTFTCVLMDLSLTHGGDGTTIISFMRNDNPANKHTPILVISACLDVDIIKRIRTQVGDILVKPFNLATLLERLKKLLGDRRAAA